VKRARAVVASTPGLAEILATDWRRVASFYARHGITETAFQSGVRDGLPEGEEPEEIPWPFTDSAEGRERSPAAYPERARAMTSVSTSNGFPSGSARVT
jgi:hypothetical protein